MSLHDIKPNRTLFEANNLILSLEREVRKLNRALTLKYGQVPVVQMRDQEISVLRARVLELEEYILKNTK